MKYCFICIVSFCGATQCVLNCNINKSVRYEKQGNSWEGSSLASVGAPKDHSLFLRCSCDPNQGCMQPLQKHCAATCILYSRWKLFCFLHVKFKNGFWHARGIEDCDAKFKNSGKLKNSAERASSVLTPDSLVGADFQNRHKMHKL